MRAHSLCVRDAAAKRYCFRRLPLRVLLQKQPKSGCILRAWTSLDQREVMASSHIVVHYHELWLKRGNRAFFLHKLREGLRRALEGIAIARISRPADRLVIERGDSAQLEDALRRLARVSGISHLGVARVVRRTDLGVDPLVTLCATAWEEVRGEQFAT